LNPEIKKLSIIIPTYKRHPFLLRLLKYYSNSEIPLNLIILDSSPEKPQDIELIGELQKKNVVWKTYDDSTYIVDKIADGFRYVETEFSVLCADDDFMIPSSLGKSINFLTANHDYNSCQGLFYSHTNATQTIKNGFTLNSIYSKARSLEEETGKDRFVKQYIDSVTNIHLFYAVHRTNVHKLIWNEATLYSEGLGYAELFPCAMSSIYGKSKILPIFYSSREPNGIIMGFIVDQNLYKEMHSLDKTLKLLNGLAKHLAKVDAISLAEAETTININSFNPIPESIRPGYVKDFDNAPPSTNSILKSIISKIIVSLRNVKPLISFIRKIKYSINTKKGCPKDLYPHFYDDFVKVKNSVLSAGLTMEQLNISRVAPTRYSKKEFYKRIK
jgi:glycosyltransferase domain-containing protein